MAAELPADDLQFARQLLDMKRDALLLATPRTSPLSAIEDKKVEEKSGNLSKKKGKGSHPKSLPETPPLSDAASTGGPKPKRAQVKNACVNCQKACKKCDDARPCQRCVHYHLEETCQNSTRRERKRGLRRGPYKRRSSSAVALDSLLDERRRSQSVPPGGSVEAVDSNPIFRALSAFEKSQLFPQTPSPFHHHDSHSFVEQGLDASMQSPFLSDGTVDLSPLFHHGQTSFYSSSASVSKYTANRSMNTQGYPMSASFHQHSPLDSPSRGFIYSPSPMKLGFKDALDGPASPSYSFDRDADRIFQSPKKLCCLQSQHTISQGAGGSFASFKEQRIDDISYPKACESHCQ